MRARERTAWRPWSRRRAAAATCSARARAQSTPTAASAAWVGVEQLTAATSSSRVRSVWWPTEAITGTAQQRHRAAQGLVAEAQQVGQRAAAAGDDHDLHLRHRQRDPTAPARSRARRGGPAPGRSPTPARPAQPRRASAASTSSRALPLSPVITPIVRGSSGRGRRFWRSSSPSASSCLRRRSMRASRSPSPATRRSVTAKEKPGRGGGAAGVVVAAAGHHDLHALRGRARRRGRSSPPSRLSQAAQGIAPVGVAQLEVHPRPRRAQVDELADQLHAGQGAELRRAGRPRTRPPGTVPPGRCRGCPRAGGLGG